MAQTPAATSAAEPLLDPPEVRSRSCGLKVMPYAGLTLPAAYSSRLVLQNRSAPAARRRGDHGRVAARPAAAPPTVDALVVTSAGHVDVVLDGDGDAVQRPGRGAVGRADDLG